MTVTIPGVLAESGCRFVKVRHGGKEAFEQEWSTTANYAADSPEIHAHLRNRGNYGVMPRGEVLIIDRDDPGLDFYLKPFHDTYTVNSSTTRTWASLPDSTGYPGDAARDETKPHGSGEWRAPWGDLLSRSVALR